MLNSTILADSIQDILTSESLVKNILGSNMTLLKMDSVYLINSDDKATFLINDRKTLLSC